MLDSITHPSRFKMLYEGLPTAFMFEKAGGVCLNSEGSPVLDIEIGTHAANQKTSVIAGSKDDVLEILKAIKGTQ
jgi:fructose-1,6-bisphosphatase